MINKFKLTLEGVPYEIERKGELILVNCQEFPWGLSGTAINVGGNPHQVEVRGDAATVDGIAYKIETYGLEEPKPTRARKAAAAAADEAGAITAVMPGLIIKVNKEVGDPVQAGDVVIVSEAMKMQNELHAKKSGVIKEITVKKGDTVEMRQVLAIIE